MAVRIKIPEAVLKSMVKPLDGRRYDEVEVVVDGEGIAFQMERTSEKWEWSRQGYELWKMAGKRKVRRSVI